ncbi:hypothetical protein HYV74_00770 [Candidatus Uhrbacteria bacterium]|nr:hypothetical protein [Candidatus Uhrbacteria bacterium]
MPPRYDEPVEVLALFTHAGIRPYRMKWGSREYGPLQVHLSHTVRNGQRQWHVFSVSDPANVFTIAFDPLALRWQLWDQR